MQNAPAFRLQSTKTERQVRVCEFLNRTLFLHLPAEFVQCLDMPKAFTGNGAKCQGAEEVNEKDLWETEKTLSAMIDELEGSEFDMIGLREFKKLLGGE